MTIATQQLDTIAQRLGMQQQQLLQEGIVHYLESRQRELQAELNLLKAHYQVATIEQFEALYETGQIEEVNTWRDYQRFDTLSFQISELKILLVDA